MPRKPFSASSSKASPAAMSPTLHGQHAAEARTERAPEVPLVPLGRPDQLRNEAIDGGQVAHHQPDRTRRLHQDLAQRERIAPRAFVIGHFPRNLPRLIGKSLQPVNPCEKATRQSPLVEDIAHRLRARARWCVAGEHTLQVLARTGLISQQVKRMAHHAVTDASVSFGSALGKI